MWTRVCLISRLSHGFKGFFPKMDFMIEFREMEEEGSLGRVRHEVSC